MKKLWHDINEIPEYPEGAGSLRLCCYEKKLGGQNLDTEYTIVDTAVWIYRKQTRAEWVAFVESLDAVKWCYYDELVSDDVFFRYDSVEEELE